MQYDSLYLCTPICAFPNFQENSSLCWLKIWKHFFIQKYHYINHIVDCNSKIAHQTYSSFFAYKFEVLKILIN